jgi:hypothetical protein
MTVFQCRRSWRGATVTPDGWVRQVTAAGARRKREACCSGARKRGVSVRHRRLKHLQQTQPPISHFEAPVNFRRKNLNNSNGTNKLNPDIFYY